MSAPSSAARERPSVRTRTDRRHEIKPAQHEAASSDPHRRPEHQVAPPEAARFPEQLIGVPFN